MSFTTHVTATDMLDQSTTTNPPTNATFATLSTYLLKSPHLVTAPKKPNRVTLTATIAALYLHPTLEATLHLLNNDLPSAHFLVRHMQAPPAVEGMLLHGILHRCEGDFGNARAWIRDVADACEGFVPKKREDGERLSEQVFEETKGCGKASLVEAVYGTEGVDGALGLVDDVERIRRGGGGGEIEEPETRIKGEMERILGWCRDKFGEGEWADASSAWVKNSAEIQAMSNDMVSGDKGWRKF